MDFVTDMADLNKLYMKLNGTIQIWKNLYSFLHIKFNHFLTHEGLIVYLFKLYDTSISHFDKYFFYAVTKQKLNDIPAIGKIMLFQCRKSEVKFYNINKAGNIRDKLKCISKSLKDIVQ